MAEKRSKFDPSHRVVTRTGMRDAELNSIFSRAPDDRLNGLVCQHIPVTAETIISAYKHGAFPWGSEPLLGTVNWHHPPQRGVLLLSSVSIGRTDRSFITAAGRDPSLHITINKDFFRVIHACASMPRSREIEVETGGTSTKVKICEETWINTDFIAAYCDLHRLGIAHSVEVRRDSRLVAGLYGVDIDGVFSGESMFHSESNVGKLALWTLIERLRDLGREFIDTQMAVGLSRKWGAELIPRAKFEILRRRAGETFKPFTW